MSPENMIRQLLGLSFLHISWINYDYGKSGEYTRRGNGGAGGKIVVRTGANVCGTSAEAKHHVILAKGNASLKRSSMRTFTELMSSTVSTLALGRAQL